jgi:diguanylate cyclase (GGDEF)-like protein
MSLLTIPTTLRRGVGRKILGLFLLASLLPVAITASLAYFEVHRSAEAEIGRTLRASAKNFGLDLFGQLQRAAAAADEVEKIFNNDGAAGLADHKYLLSQFAGIWVMDLSGDTTPIVGPIDAALNPDIFATALTRSANPGLLVSRNNNGGRVSMLRRIEKEGSGGLLVLQLNTERIWGTIEDHPYRTDFCVYTSSGEALHCSSAMLSGIHELLSDHANSGAQVAGEWQQDGETYLGATWQLFLGGEFGAPSLDIIAMQPKSYALQTGADFRRVFLPALLLVVLLVGVLSFSAIGESLTPLQRLTSAVRQITAGNLETRLRIRSNDEFEWLGEAFNKMASKLGQQFSILRAMSEIDRQILSGAKFEQVSESVITHLVSMTGARSAAVIARDTDTPHWAKMISTCDHEFIHERIALPMELGHQWCQPRQVSLEESSLTIAPYRERFMAFGMKFVALVPVVLQGDLKGILLLGSVGRLNLEQDSLVRCVDLAGRFAVALASVEREEVLYRQAHFDELTGLPNRQLLKDRLAQHIVQARRDDFSGALLFLDLDRFKAINDVYGHSVGDVVLTQAAERIVGEVRDSDTVARLGGDEFVVVLPHISSDNLVHATATRLLDRLTDSFSVRGNDHFVGASIGIVMFPEDGDSVETLLKNADAAMYRAKEAGRARFEFFSKKLNAESRRKISLERDLRAAFHNDKLQVYFQPQFDLATGIICGAEALLRWDHGHEGFVPPAEFVPLAEESGLISEIGSWVIEQVCLDLRRILNRGLHPGAVSINVSARQLREPSFASDVLATLRRFDIHPGYLLLEVTESAVAQNRDTVIGVLNTLRSEGVQVAIDDFGTGYSSLSYLQQLPFDIIKIDKSFIDRIGIGDPSDKICRTIIRMAHEMGKLAIAEGVENAAQVAFLKKNRCNFVQGYFYGKPMPQVEFLNFIEKQEFHTQRRKALELVKT